MSSTTIDPPRHKHGCLLQPSRSGISLLFPSFFFFFFIYVCCRNATLSHSVAKKNRWSIQCLEHTVSRTARACGGPDNLFFFGPNYFFFTKPRSFWSFDRTRNKENNNSGLISVSKHTFPWSPELRTNQNWLYLSCTVALVFCTKLYIKLAFSLCSFSQFSFLFNFQTANAVVLKFGTLPFRCLFSNTLLAIFDIVFRSKVIHCFVPKNGPKMTCGRVFQHNFFSKANLKNLEQGFLVHRFYLLRKQKYCLWQGRFST